MKKVDAKIVKSVVKGKITSKDSLKTSKLFKLTAKSDAEKGLDLAQQEALIRLKRASGHLTSVMTMVEDKRNCGEVLQQLSAVISALGGARISLLQGHINSCLKNNLKPGHDNLVKELDIIIQRGMKI